MKALSCVVALVTASVAAAQTPPAEAPAPGFVRLAGGTPVMIAVADAMTSKTAKIDDFFAIRLITPITVDGVVIVPAGTTGKGQVVHAAKARALGKAGELILAARSLTCGTTEIGLRGFRFSGEGRDKSHDLTKVIAVGSAAANAAAAYTGYAALPLMFVSGGEMVVPAGTYADAKVRATIDVPAALAGSCPVPGAKEISTGDKK
ncbi:hypothetical protein [Sphingomonas immobilis]|uniref:Uncharacterized protein n=1 Tax=Sphingomonas immobilis TaxID=3063997 RepID=A0ABT8ZTT2_9SPHN|nr:hypothetical protein [Sphingomonas sp. CA1-15]MDO7840976.1 hypothetical protein [Sphingomonas sp. CA1-15]